MFRKRLRLNLICSELNGLSWKENEKDIPKLGENQIDVKRGRKCNSVSLE